MCSYKHIYAYKICESIIHVNTYTNIHGYICCVFVCVYACISFQGIISVLNVFELTEY